MLIVKVHTLSTMSASAVMRNHFVSFRSIKYRFENVSTLTSLTALPLTIVGSILISNSTAN